MTTSDAKKTIRKLKSMSYRQCKAYCKKIRRKIYKVSYKNGGHLASNLGTVELTAALYRVFDFPDDKLVWDVGHQAYAAKIITGRDISTVRTENGISGFCKPSESAFDPVITGHSSTSISSALGLAEAMAIKGGRSDRAAIAVIGDGAFTGGLAYEALNNAGKSGRNIIVILNQNDMSIGKNVGAVAKYLSSVRINKKYLHLKQWVKSSLRKVPVIGAPITSLLERSKGVLKDALYHSTMFEQFGFVYIGPVNGHNLPELEKALAAAKNIARGDEKTPSRPVFLHVNTVKGKGFAFSEKNPGAYHFLPAHHAKKCPPEVSCDSFSYHIGNEILMLADQNPRIAAITAAMKHAVGLAGFAERFPERFFDVGIAEAHAVTFAGGLATAGIIPVFCVYSSFLQRAYDQIIHDLAIAGLHAVLCIDRAGFVGEDGETHQGLFDILMLTSIPNVTIFAPSNFEEARFMLKKAVAMSGIVAVRYPKCVFENGDSNVFHGNADKPYEMIENNSDICAVGYGRQFNAVFAAANRMKNRDIVNIFNILKLNQIFPIILPDTIVNYKAVVIFEESMKSGGIAEHIAAKLAETGFHGNLKIVAVEGFVPQGTAASQLKKFSLDSDGVSRIMSETVMRLRHAT
jgi:1-deoxy-D-xylulose-5-phosphate synthase